MLEGCLRFSTQLIRISRTPVCKGLADRVAQLPGESQRLRASILGPIRITERKMDPAAHTQGAHSEIGPTSTKGKRAMNRVIVRRGNALHTRSGCFKISKHGVCIAERPPGCEIAAGLLVSLG